jgi:curved DNA-binding protein CbpA
MMLKRIEDWNYYELLSVERTASPDEIWAAYQSALTTYRTDSPALYGLVGEAERALVLERVQKAFQTLRDPEKRKEYDRALLRHAPYFPPKAPFRKSVGKLEIEEAPPKKRLGARIREMLRRRRGA